MKTSDTLWKLWQKFCFRFFFLFLGLTSCLCWNDIIFMVYFAFAKGPRDLSVLSNLYHPLTGIFHWLDVHIYHTGYNPKIHSSFPGGDSHFCVILYATTFFVVIIAAIAWSIADRKRSSYDKLFYWFNLYLRYLLAITIFTYGIDKLIPVQMARPGVELMMTPFGEFDKYTLFWSVMGVSKGYMMFSGIFEIIASLLLFSRRTVVAGYLFMTAVLANVAALNWYYNVSVKIFSTHLLLCTLFLLAPFTGKLFQTFFKNNPTPFTEKSYPFKTRWKANLLRATLIFFPLAICIIVTIGVWNRYGSRTADSAKERIYEVTSFAAKDSLPAITSDTLRWKRLLLNVRTKYAVVYNMIDWQSWSEFSVDSVKKTFTFQNSNKKKSPDILRYTYPSKTDLVLTGKWKGRNILVSLKLYPVDSLDIMEDKIRLIQE